MPQRSPIRAACPCGTGAAVILLTGFLTLTAGRDAAAVPFDFSAALHDLHNGSRVEEVQVDNVTMTVEVECHASNVAIAFDSEDPGDYKQLGTPNEDFDGPGRGDGGESGEEGENRSKLGNVLVIAEDESDENADGQVDFPAPELEDGVLWLQFSHAGYLKFTLLNVDDGETHIVAYRDHEVVGELDADELGENSVQEIDLSRFGTVDRVAIDMDSISAVAAIQLDVPVTGIEPRSWTGVKRTYR